MNKNIEKLLESALDVESKNTNFTMDDIYYKMNQSLMNTPYHQLQVEGKKQVIEQELKKYYISKILELNPKTEIDEDMDLCLSVELLGNIIPKGKYQDISQFVHFLLQIAGSLQGFSIIWSIKNDIKEPILEYTDNGHIDELITSEDMDLILTFKFIFDIFKNHFMVSELVKKIETINSQNN